MSPSITADMESQVPIFRFGPFESRPRVRELYKHGVKLKVRPQPLQVLNVLLSHAGQVVTREQFREQVWSSETFVDFEHGLNTSVKEIRAVLGDSADEPRYIQTLPRIGYRFVAPVNVDLPLSCGEVVPAPQAIASEESVGRTMDGRGLRQKSAHRVWLIVLGLLVLLIGALGGYFRWSRSRMRSQVPSGKIMLAVLPFENLTGDSAQDYFSDGMTEEMISQLGRIDPEQLGVIARTSIMHYKHNEKPLDQIGRELGVQYVLEGSVRRDSDKVRISAQLIQVKDQTHLWSRQYDRELSSLLVLQGEIAQEIADEIQLTLGDDREQLAANLKPSVSPTSYEAYDLYLKGRYFWNKRTVRGFQQAINCFQQALAKDPNYSRAYAGLADSYALLGGYSMVPQTEFMSKAKVAALRALQIDDELPEAHTSLALITENYDWDWQTAEKEYRRAIQLDPNYATAHHWYAEYLTWLGRFDEASRESERARQLDPFSLIIAADNAAILYYSRHYDRAIQQFQVVQDMDPTFPRFAVVINACVEKRRFADALAHIENGRLALGDGPWRWSALAYVYGRAGQPGQARRELEKLKQSNSRSPIDPGGFVFPYVALGDKEQAFAWLEKAYSQHSNSMILLKVEPAYDSLRSDRRFKDLMRRVRLAE
jgi:TolB-like protein/DNA-binding winged helix-turn-helix (wHTH) protein/Tfp pilus assembly protein PilF